MPVPFCDELEDSAEESLSIWDVVVPLTLISGLAVSFYLFKSWRQPA